MTGRVSASSAMIGAVSSIRLLLVSPGSPPNISRTCPRWRSTAPQPPGPGLGRHPPSVWITTGSAVSVIAPRIGGEISAVRTDIPNSRCRSVVIRRPGWTASLTGDVRSPNAVAVASMSSTT